MQPETQTPQQMMMPTIGIHFNNDRSVNVTFNDEQPLSLLEALGLIEIAKQIILTEFK